MRRSENPAKLCRSGQGLSNGQWRCLGPAGWHNGAKSPIGWDYQKFLYVGGTMGQSDPTMSRRKEPATLINLLSQLVAGGAASAAFKQGGLLDTLKRTLTERAVNADGWRNRRPSLWPVMPRTPPLRTASLIPAWR
ncbi:hypothetical protein NOVOSPHI9U_210026 [Novosphingobium sp. 9U]|nr:hypothetical protein NOVOSPHI9U_210026 [Novosphingobium sp. 9U]